MGTVRSMRLAAVAMTRLSGRLRLLFYGHARRRGRGGPFLGRALHAQTQLDVGADGPRFRRILTIRQEPEGHSEGTF